MSRGISKRARCEASIWLISWLEPIRYGPSQSGDWGVVQPVSQIFPFGSRRSAPDGQISGSPVQPLLQKYLHSLLTQITSTSLAIPAQYRGAFRDRHERRAGVRWTRLRF